MYITGEKEEKEDQRQRCGGRKRGSPRSPRSPRRSGQRAGRRKVPAASEDVGQQDCCCRGVGPTCHAGPHTSWTLGGTTAHSNSHSFQCWLFSFYSRKINGCWELPVPCLTEEKPREGLRLAPDHIWVSWQR